MIVLLLACNKPQPVDTDSDTVVDTEVPDTGVLGEEEPPLVPDVIVDCNGGGDYTTIRQAIDASSSGTKIGLAPCTYNEDVSFEGKALNLFGLEGPAVTTIRGSGNGSVIRANHGETLGTRVAGVTITGGKTPGYAGAGVFVDLATMSLEDVVFTGNVVGTSVVYGNGAWIEMLDVTFDATNKVEDSVVILTNGSSISQRLKMTCDSATKTGIYQHNAMMMLDSDLNCGTDYGVYNQGNGSHIRRSRVESEGIALRGGDANDTRNERVWLSNSAFIGGDTAVYALYMDVEIENVVFWGGRIGLDMQYANVESFVYNSVGHGSECGIRTENVEPYDFGWNAVDGSGSGCHDGGTDAVTGDFGFVDAPTDFELKPDSPLKDAGNPEKDFEDADETRNDIGRYGGREGRGQR